MKNKMIIATSQFPVSRDIKKNTRYILKQLKAARDGNAAIAHFSESSLCGYAGIDFESVRDQDQDLLLHSLDLIRKRCRDLEIFSIIGGNHFEVGKKKPFNSLWLIAPDGEIRDRYDKRFLTGNFEEEDHFHFTPGKRRVIFEIGGVKCGLLICHEWRYPELYRDYKKSGAELVFQSWYDGGLTKSEHEKEGAELGNLITGTVRGNAANNYLWISASNTSRPQSSFPAFVARPDGRIIRQANRNKTGLLFTEIDLSQKFVDPSGPWRDRASGGILHSA